MTEELPLTEESAPSSEPLTTSGLPEADKKRVVIGAAIGGGIFLGVLIAIIVLVSTEASKPHPRPKPPNPPTRYPYYNPYTVDSYVVESERVRKLVLTNKRKEFEAMNEPYNAPYGYVPIVKETPENLESQRLEVFVIDYDEHLARFIYIDPTFQRWHVPYYGNHSDPYAHAARYTHTQTGFAMQHEQNSTFEWHYGGKIGKYIPLISTFGCRLQYFDKYVEFEAILDKDYIYGMGQRIESFHLKNDNYSLWNRYLPYEVGGDTENGMYGSHPFILNRLTTTERDDFIGLFMRNSNAMLFSIWDNLHNGTIINYKMIGGIIDLFLFHTADPQYILRKYHSVIGRPYLPPIWSMGLQQARAGYTVQDFKKIIETHQQHHIPIDALWADDTMNDKHQTFTVNKDSFAGIKELVTKMHDHKEGIDMHFVAIANPALLKSNSYKYYLEAIKENCLIKSAAHFESPYEGRTIAGEVVWLDFFLYNSTLIWAGGLHDLYDATLFDGIWICDNEIYNLCSGECVGSETEADGEITSKIPNPFHKKTEFNYIPYRPTLDPLEADTLPMAAYHFGDEMYHKQYYTHNLFGLQISQATYTALNGIFEHKRFFIASRSTWPGSGQFASHWLDGNYASWDSMIYSIPGILNFNMFGIPHVGAPIGGYYQNASEELLTRWFELGSFYPLMLSYSFSEHDPKEAYTYPHMIPYIKDALIERYSLIRFMYTKMFEAHAWGGAVIHPLFFDFTNDTKLYDREIVDKTFMWAHTLYIIPSLIPHQTNVKVYLPNWKWYNLRTKNLELDYNPLYPDGHYIILEQPLGYINILIKGGSIVPYQHYAHEARIMNVKDLELIPAQILIAPDHNGKAIGSMIVDSEGIRPHPGPNSNTYRHYTFTYMNQIFRINKLDGFDFHGDYEFDYFWELIIMDVMGRHQVDFVCMMDMYMKKKELEHIKSTSSDALIIHDHRAAKMPMYSLESIVWGSNDQHDFCKFEVHLTHLNLENEKREMMGVLETRDPEAYRLKFDFVAKALTNHIVYLSIIKNEPNVKEWRVPEEVLVEGHQKVKADKTLDAVGFGTSAVGESFFFEMSEEDDPHDFLLTTRNQPFVYVRNFIQVKFMVTGRHIFGLGERVGKFELDDGLYSIWNYDAMHEETGIPPGNNMYGSHPFYMIHTHNPKDFAGVFFFTTNPMDVRIRHIGMNTEIDHILSGGVIEAFFIGKGTAEHILREYHSIIGRPTPLPFWVFGYHQSRWGYSEIRQLEEVIHTFESNSIPLDGVWMDKDFMKSYKSFTIDTRYWRGLSDLVKKLHEKGKHFVAIVDAGIAIDNEYEIYTRGLAENVYIKSSFTNEPLVGITWAGYTVWVDYVKTISHSFWIRNLDDFHKLVDFDGIWLDMNEPSNFCDGECPDKLSYHYYFFPLDYYDDLYYNPTHRPLETKTISMEALHDGDPAISNEFNYHSLYGFYQSKATAEFFHKTLHRRPFIVSSATYPGTGRYATHWLGDNYSSWMNMRYSIAGMLNFNMFGIPFVGANICGYSGNATVDMCARWMQLGAFYPFMRNHNSPEGSPQEPYQDPLLMSVSKKAIQIRYSLVRYIYTEYMHTVLRGGSMIRPLIFTFPEDNETYTTIDTSFMIGPALRVVPILDGNEDHVETYFPNANWYHFVPGEYKKIVSYDHTSHKGKVVTVHGSLKEGNINVYFRSGMIFPYQEVSEGITNVLMVHNLPVNLIVTPNYHHTAYGELLYDSEHHESFRHDHQDLIMHLNGTEITFRATGNRHNIGYNYTDMYLHKVILVDAERYKTITNVVCEFLNKSSIGMKSPVYDSTHKIVTLETQDPHSVSFLDLAKIHWSHPT